MKTLKILALFTGLALSITTHAKDQILSGTVARTMMEALIGAGFDIPELDGDLSWSEVGTFHLDSGPIQCTHNTSTYPDSWVSNVECFKSITDQEPLKNSLNLFRVIQTYAFGDTGVPVDTYSVSNISCQFVYDSKSYSCTITK